MKKLVLLAAALCFTMMACNNQNENAAAEQAEPTEEQVQHHCGEGHHECCGMSEEQKAECQAMREQMENWENLSDDAKKELVNKMKACMDAKEAEMQAKKAEMDAKKAEMDAKWANWDNLTLDEQKALLDAKRECMHRHGNHGPQQHPCGHHPEGEGEHHCQHQCQH